jgi:GT2 family glycosyltransferase
MPGHYVTERRIQAVASLTAVVPATNRPQTLARCVGAIERAADPPDELVVVEQPAAAGPAAARNLGARRATGELICFVDADVEVHPDAFARVRAAFAADPELVGVFGSYDDEPPNDGAVSAFRNLLHHHVHQSAPGPASTFWAGLGALRRDAFLASGGFDERKYPESSIEDIELGMRLSADGARIVLDPSVQGRHLKHWTLGSMVATDFSRRGVPWVELLLRSGGGRDRGALNLGWRHRASAAVAVLGALAAAARRPAAALAALATLAWLNRDFYGLLARRRGPRVAALGLGLHALHHVTSAAAVPAGVAAYLRGRRA